MGRTHPLFALGILVCETGQRVKADLGLGDTAIRLLRLHREWDNIVFLILGCDHMVTPGGILDCRDQHPRRSGAWEDQRMWTC